MALVKRKFQKHKCTEDENKSPLYPVVSIYLCRLLTAMGQAGLLMLLICFFMLWDVLTVSENAVLDGSVKTQCVQGDAPWLWFSI